MNSVDEKRRSSEHEVAASYPSGVGTKFEVDGRVKSFPGNTIICHLPETSALKPVLQTLYDTLQSSNLAHLYSLLPPTSWHMTVFDGVLDAARVPGLWPADLPSDAPMDDCDELFMGKLAGFDLRAELPFDLTIAGWKPLVDGIGLRLQPTTGTEERKLRELRDRLAQLLGVRDPQHDAYVFHLSIAYLIRHPTNTERSNLQTILNDALTVAPSRLSLGAPEFCRFEDMFGFHRKLFLENRS